MGQLGRQGIDPGGHRIEEPLLHFGGFTGGRGPASFEGSLYAAMTTFGTIQTRATATVFSDRSRLCYGHGIRLARSDIVPWLREIEPQAVTMNHDDAAIRGIIDGDSYTFSAAS